MNFDQPRMEEGGTESPEIGNTGSSEENFEMFENHELIVKQEAGSGIPELEKDYLDKIGEDFAVTISAMLAEIITVPATFLGVLQNLEQGVSLNIENLMPVIVMALGLPTVGLGIDLVRNIVKRASLRRKNAKERITLAGPEYAYKEE